ncbi:SHOCT domain-containing protein [Stackebrandtia nassauensis]|uniref:SHOCT domain-containing protein n=1 Tax=Stackebrandtia nassauensis (strain DSM 44728 / CIP 108903 / NRRL B-16338 / NBRC 102104 / LLR-40K-21) TaxID=446470 RepID=D3PVJ2_STANL|nr:SHOCT domain-containing protein [Stackebrandtia nassauensis]ADD43106.1 conserved hypothetical protein [Stackebrandtia nassauensis DSM 44728]
MMYWDNDMGPAAWVFMTLNHLVVWALLVGAIWLAVRAVRHYVSHGGGVTHPERVLAERFAKGEIDEAEYRERLDVLRGHARS